MECVSLLISSTQQEFTIRTNHSFALMPYRIDTLIVLVSLVCLLLEVDSKLAFLALVRPIKLLRYIYHMMHSHLSACTSPSPFPQDYSSFYNKSFNVCAGGGQDRRGLDSA